MRQFLELKNDKTLSLGTSIKTASPFKNAYDRNSFGLNCAITPNSYLKELGQTELILKFNDDVIIPEDAIFKIAISDRFQQEENQTSQNVDPTPRTKFQAYLEDIVNQEE